MSTKGIIVAALALAALFYAQRANAAKAGAGGIGITVACDPDNPGACSGSPASSYDDLDETGSGPIISPHQV